MIRPHPFSRPHRAARAAAALAALWMLSIQAAHAAHPNLCIQGQRQSPIDITAPRPAAVPALRFDYRSAPLRIVNDSHTVRVRFANGSRLWLGTQPLVLQQFHFHVPGGDRILGEDFPLGMHFLHKSPSGQLVAMVVLFRLGAENQALAQLLPHLPQPGAPEQVVPGASADPQSLIPLTHGYYAYEGSETAPRVPRACTGW